MALVSYRNRKKQQITGADKVTQNQRKLTASNARRKHHSRATYNLQDEYNDANVIFVPGITKQNFC